MDAGSLLPRLIRAAAEGPWRVVDIVEAALRPLGFSTRRLEGDHGAAMFTRGEARLVLSGHVDVVPVGEGWTRAPFGGELAEGRVWGRGACDMLGAVACFVEAASLAPESPCAILLTTDEETSMKAAERVLAEGWLARVDGVVVGEPTHHAVGIAEKGVLWLRISTSGRNAHGSMPELGDNAAERLLRALPHALAVPLQGEHALLGRPTKNLGQMHAGEAVNQVPASAYADLDVRYLPGTHPEQLRTRIHRALDEAQEGARLDMISSHVPFESDPTRGLAKIALDAVRSHRGDARALGLPYGTEASKFAPAGFDVVILGPGEANLAHTNVESIALDDLASGAAIYARLLRAYSEKRA